MIWRQRCGEHFKGAPVNNVSGFGGTDLTQAATNGHLNVVKWFIEHGSTVDFVKNGDERKGALEGDFSWPRGRFGISHG